MKPYRCGIAGAALAAPSGEQEASMQKCQKEGAFDEGSEDKGLDDLKQHNI